MGVQGFGVAVTPPPHSQPFLMLPLFPSLMHCNFTIPLTNSQNIYIFKSIYLHQSM